MADAVQWRELLASAEAVNASTDAVLAEYESRWGYLPGYIDETSPVRGEQRMKVEDDERDEEDERSDDDEEDETAEVDPEAPLTWFDSLLLTIIVLVKPWSFRSVHEGWREVVKRLQTLYHYRTVEECQARVVVLTNHARAGTLSSLASPAVECEPTHALITEVMAAQEAHEDAGPLRVQRLEERMNTLEAQRREDRQRIQSLEMKLEDKQRHDAQRLEDKQEFDKEVASLHDQIREMRAAHEAEIQKFDHIVDTRALQDEMLSSFANRLQDRFPPLQQMTPTPQETPQSALSDWSKKRKQSPAQTPGAPSKKSRNEALGARRTASRIVHAAAAPT